MNKEKNNLSSLFQMIADKLKEEERTQHKEDCTPIQVIAAEELNQMRFITGTSDEELYTLISMASAITSGLFDSYFTNTLSDLQTNYRSEISVQLEAIRAAYH